MIKDKKAKQAEPTIPTSLLTPGNDRGDTLVPTLFSPLNMNAYTISIQNSILVDKHEITAYYTTIQINVI